MSFSKAMSSFGPMNWDKLVQLADTQNKKVDWSKQLKKFWGDDVESLQRLLDNSDLDEIDDCLANNLDVLYNVMKKHNSGWTDVYLNTYVDDVVNGLKIINPFRDEPYIETDPFSTNFPFNGCKEESLLYIFLLQSFITPKVKDKLIYDFSFFHPEGRPERRAEAEVDAF